MAVPLLDLTRQYASIQDELEAAALAVLRSGIYVHGPEVSALENELAAYIGSKHVVGMSSGTDALLASLMALGIGHGDVVVLPVYSFFATAGVVSRLGARPVFVDIEPTWCNMSLDALRQALDAEPETKAVIFVHLYGAGAGVAEVAALLAERGIPLVEDAAQAIGTHTDGAAAGTFGRCGCFSTFPSKSLGGAGDGGFVSTDDDAFAERLRRTRNHGQSEAYKHTFVGDNFRLDALQAAVLRVKLRHLDGWIESRRGHAARYREQFGHALQNGEITIPTDISDRHSYHQFVSHVAADQRDDAIAALRTKDIGCNIYYPLPFHLQPCFADLGYRAGDFPVAERASASNIALPIFPELREDEQDEVVAALSGVLGKTGSTA